MKILLVNNYWYRRGGSEAVLLSTKRLLQSAGHIVVCFGLEHDKNEVVLDYAVKIPQDKQGEFLHGFHSLYNIRARQAFRECLLKEKPDVIHIHNIYHHLSFSLCEEIRACKIPAVITLHDYKLFSLQYRMYHHGQIDIRTKNNILSALYNNVMESVLQTVGVVLEYSLRVIRKWDKTYSFFLAPSEYMLQCGLDSFVDPTRIAVVYNPIAEKFFDKKNELIPFAEQSGVLFFGRLVEEKGLSIVNELIRRLPNISFRIAGSGDIIPTGNNCTYLGQLSPEALYEEIRHAKIVIVPSLWPENAPMSVVETLALGTAVLASKIGGIGEWVDKDWLVDKYDNVDEWVRLLNDKYHDTTDFESDRRRKQDLVYQRHNEATYTKQIDNIYKQVCR